MAGTICSTAKTYLEGLADLCDRIDANAIDELAGWLLDIWKTDNQVIVFGNGGSAYTASHFITDLVKTASVEGKRRLRAISLVDNYGLTTALGNDISYDKSLVYPLETYGRPGDIAIAVSCSGNSPNVVEACEWAKANGMRVACLTGFAGGKIAKIADLHINIPSDNYGLIEDLHLSINHMICQAFHSQLESISG